MAMSIKLKREFILLPVIAVLIAVGASCNSKTTDDENEIAVTPALVAVKNFHLQANDSVMAHLDSVFFSIDLNTGVIFNADSLPKGTDVRRLIPSITFANTMSKAEISFVNSEGETTVIDYLTNPSDTIDFSSPVILDVTAEDGINTFSYLIKVNVHLQEPDMLSWDRLATSVLPSRFENPVAQRTVIRNDVVYCLVMEDNEEFTMSVCSDLNEGKWDKKMFNPGFFPDPETFTATPEAFYILDMTGKLYTSADLSDWTDTGVEWMSILGAYGNAVLGIKGSATNFTHTIYPLPEGYQEQLVADNFPVYHTSDLGLIETKYADRPMAILACGLAKGGVLQSDVWAFDGQNWAIINSKALPKLEKPMLARYVVFRDTSMLFNQRRFDVWLLFGGTDLEGEVNKKVYMSYDNGVNWTEAPEGMQLPESYPDLMGSDVIVAGYDLTADLSEAWTKPEETKSRAVYEIEGFDITWVCPYLYIFGGYLVDEGNSLSTTIYRGVLQRLEFVPEL
ncbi:MAG: hypothetical protein J1F43_07680 [Muribaculaceae bacterium]|nr:hypothetical protein [Muribaculaceae bacterium]